MICFLIAICDRTSLVSLTGNHEVVYGLWNTTVFGDGTLATSDSPIVNYVGYEGPKYALDKDRLTKYVNFGNCTVGTSQLDCGLNTGFYLTPQQGATLLLGIQFTTASDDSSRDPLSITIEGSNATSSALMLGTSWSLIYHSSTGLDMDPGRTMDGTFQCIFVNKNWYTSYRVLVASKRGESNSVQYAEVVLFGHKVPDKGKNFVLWTFIVTAQLLSRACSKKSPISRRVRRVNVLRTKSNDDVL